MIGTTIGHYKIESKLGEGGMGVVYKAQDTKLNRKVALKFLPEHVSATEQDAARFTQEAQAAASLNHPNICTIHGIEEQDGKTFIVMEFVEGKTLQETKPSLSLRQAVEISVQIADGLAAAHEKGITHRDIKPENIMIRKDGIAQIMDFGLAKLRGVSRLTKEGSTVGTAFYMSPEQVQGMEADHRSDIFSFGVLMFEMFTGQLPFKGMHETAVSYEIVNVDSPPMSSIRLEITPELDAIVLDCLEKDPRERTQAASQVALELKRYRRESSRSRASRITAAKPVPSKSSIAPSTSPGEGETPDQSGPAWRRVPFALIGSVAGALAIGFVAAMFLFNTRPGDQILLTTPLKAPDGLRFETAFGGNSVVSPDGTMLAFVGADSAGQTALYIRPFAEQKAAKLAGTEGATYPFWSPDNKSVAYFSEGKLLRVDVAGNPPLTIADAPSGRGGAWSREGVIVFASDINNANFSIVPAGGGTQHIITTLDTASGKAPRFPSFLPDGRHYLFVTMELSGGASVVREDYQTYVGSIEGGQEQIPLRGASNMFFASGHLIFVRQGTLIAQRFDPTSYELLGDPVPIDKNINVWPERAKADFSVSQNGVLLYAYGVLAKDGEFAWMTLNRSQQSITSANVQYWAQLSPDQNLIAYDEYSKNDRNLDVWVYDIKRQVKNRFTFDPREELLPVWSRDGRTIYYGLNEKGSRYGIYAKRTDRADNAVEVASHPTLALYPIETSRDNKYLLVLSEGSQNGLDLGYVELGAKGEFVPLVQSAFNESWGDFSPDGRWYIYSSNETGRTELYIRPFLRDGAKFQATSGGVINQFIWAASGDVIYRTTTAMMSIGVDLTGPIPQFSTPKKLFDAGPETGITHLLDVTPDGKRLLVSRSSPNTSSNELTLVMNWQKLVEKE